MGHGNWDSVWIIEKSIILESSNGRESTNLGRVVMCRSGETVLEGFSIKEQKSLGKKGTRISRLADTATEDREISEGSKSS